MDPGVFPRSLELGFHSPLYNRREARPSLGCPHPPVAVSTHVPSLPSVVPRPRETELICSWKHLVFSLKQTRGEARPGPGSQKRERPQAQFVQKQLLRPTSEPPGPGRARRAGWRLQAGDPGARRVHRGPRRPRHPCVPGFVTPGGQSPTSISKRRTPRLRGAGGFSGLTTRPAAPTGHSSVPLQQEPCQNSWQPGGQNKDKPRGFGC